MLTEVKPNKEMSSDQTPTKNLYMQYIKRPLGFVLSLVALIVLSPVLLVIALLVRIKLGSPIIFKQERPGKDERPFTLYKFRTMSDERDKNGNLLPDNLRATSFGNMLRKTSLDELPELFNILNGDMSIVGPRPLMVEYLPYYSEEERRRHAVRPGLTGLAQIYGRNYLSWEDRFKLDNEYIDNCSIMLDCRIIWATILQVLKRENIADMEGVRVDEKGTYVYHRGQVFRRLDVERSEHECDRNMQ
jgi:undecaprenyl phosphate N,N'-diacetylbacillosamine 1-phosphate transferase